MTAAQVVDIPSFIDNNKVSRSQLLILIMVGIAVVMDGFDVQAMGYVAPAIIKDWGVSKAELGPVFGAGLFGMLVGSLALSVMADKIGRRPVLIWATVFFAAFMLAAAKVTTIFQLQVIRFITGLLIQFKWTNSEIFLAMAVPTVISAVMLMLFAGAGGNAPSKSPALIDLGH